MTKRLLIAILATGMMFHVSGCSSSGTQEEGDTAVANDEAFAEEGEGDFAEESTGDGGSEVASNDGEEAAPADEGGGDELSLDDEQSVADNGEAPPADDSGDELSLENSGDELALEGDSGGDGLPEDIATESAPADPKPPVANEPPPSDEPVFGAEGGTDVAGGDTGTLPEEPSSGSTDVASSGTSDTGSSSAGAPAAAPAAFLPLLKVKDTAFTKNGTLLNRVYMGRSGDTVKSVSNKIYGSSDRASDLKKWNGFLSRGVKTGDKIYYSSPRDPNDTRMLTYYEDVGMQPSVYVSKEGDNIRRVSKQLLGSSDSWKEVWATNLNVESKGDIPSGTELRYWPEGAEGAAPVVASAGAHTPPMEAAPPPDMAQAPPPPPPPTDPMSDPLAPPPNMAMNDPLAPPGPGPASTPDTGAAAAGAMEAPQDPLAPPPPPPPEPPAPPKPKKAPPVDVATSNGSDPDTMMAMGFGGILLIAAAVLFVVIRKNRAKRMDLGQTQV